MTTPTTAVIVANGEFPHSPHLIEKIKKAPYLVCCDGAMRSLHSLGIVPKVIIGDLDSLPSELKKQYANLLHYVDNQENNDLSKAVDFLHNQGCQEIEIVGATGKREDHALGNLSLLFKYNRQLPTKILTDYGTWMVLNQSGSIACRKGQAISLFAYSPTQRFSSEGLQYPLENLSLEEWWMGTLNTCISDSFSIAFSQGQLLIFLAD